MATNHKSKDEAAPTEHQREARALIDTAGGEAAAAADIGIDRQTFARVIAGLPVRRGTLALLREKFGRAAS